MASTSAPAPAPPAIVSLASPIPENSPQKFEFPPDQPLPFKATEFCGTESNPPSTPRPPESTSSTPLSSASVSVVIPSYARWFSWDQIHETERRILPEFFDSKSPSRNPRVYRYYRDSIIKKYRGNPTKKVAFTEVRREIVGDVGSIRRVFDFLENWGLINFVASLPPSAKSDEKEGRPASVIGASPGLVTSHVDSPGSVKEVGKKVCDGCKSAISIACFSCEKVDLVLCARCFVRGNYRAGLNSADFKRVDIGDVITRKDWSDRETLLLLEAVLHYGDDWKKVAQHVTGRSEKECAHWFIKLPFAEQFLEPNDIDDIDKCSGLESDPIDTTDGTHSDLSLPAKRICLSPLTDASNPIMAQAAFLSALVGSEVAKAAADAAIATVSNASSINLERQSHSISSDVKQEAEALDEAEAEAKARSLLEQEKKDIEHSVSAIILQMKEIRDKIIHFEHLELAMEKEWAQLKGMRSQLFEDKLKLLQQRAPSRSSGIIETDKV